MVLEQEDLNYDNWLIIEVASEPQNDVVARWLVELMVNEREVSPASAARFVAELQLLGAAAAELIAHTRPLTCSASR